MLKDNATILFQGDSITDAGRTYDYKISFPEELPEENFGLGYGYPFMIKNYLDVFHRGKNIKVLNRAISGNRSIDLVERWKEDCLDLKPDYLSILVGVNDVWRRYDGTNIITTPQEYEDNLHKMISSVKNQNENCEIILLEPFLLPVDKEKECYREDLDPKIHILRKIAREYNATYIPFDGVFASQWVSINPEELSYDGVHLTQKGHSIIAKMWLDIIL